MFNLIEQNNIFEQNIGGASACDGYTEAKSEFVRKIRALLQICNKETVDK